VRLTPPDTWAETLVRILTARWHSHSSSAAIGLVAFAGGDQLVLVVTGLLLLSSRRPASSIRDSPMPVRSALLLLQHMDAPTSVSSRSRERTLRDAREDLE